MEEFDGAAAHVGRAVAVTRQFDIDEAGVFIVGEHAQNRREIEFTLPKHQVLVFAVADVFEVNVPHKIGVTAINLPQGRGLCAKHMADVERQAKAGTGDVFFQNFEFCHVVHQHAGLGLKGELDAPPFGVVRELQAACDQPVPRFLFGRLRLQKPGPEADTLGV